MKRMWMTVALAAGCGPGTSDPIGGPCGDLCDALVTDCGYAAFPTYESCEQGCAFTASEGADVSGQATCITDAACDTFAILECQNAYGN